MLPAALAALLALPPAEAEVSPGNSDLGYKVYELVDPASGSSLGMMVAVGTATVPANVQVPFQPRTAYWYWTTANSGGLYCYSGANATPFPARSVAMKLRFSGTTGGESDPWAISASGVVKGCKPNATQGKIVGQVPLAQARTAFVPTQDGATAWWTVSTSDGSASGAAWLAPRTTGGQDYGWALQTTPSGGACAPVNPAPTFSVPPGGTITLTSVASTALPTLPCAQVGVDFIP